MLLQKHDQLHYIILGQQVDSQTPQQTFQRCFNVAFWLIRRRDVGKRQINVVYFNVDMNNVRQRRNNVVKMTFS